VHVKKKGEKSKEDISNWCGIDKIPWHNNEKFYTRQWLLIEIKESNYNSPLFHKIPWIGGK